MASEDHGREIERFQRHTRHEVRNFQSDTTTPTPQANRTSLIVVVVICFVVIMAILAHSWSFGSSSIPAKASGATNAAIASGVHCAPQSGRVLVTGTLTGNANVPAYSGVSATVYGTGGGQIGSAEGPIEVLNNGQSQPFHITVSVTGTPASCFVTWGGGLPPG
jgi:hypothetical protein